MLGFEGNDCILFFVVSIVNSFVFNFLFLRLKWDDKFCKLIGVLVGSIRCFVGLFFDVRGWMIYYKFYYFFLNLFLCWERMCCVVKMKVLGMVIWWKIVGLSWLERKCMLGGFLRWFYDLGMCFFCFYLFKVKIVFNMVFNEECVVLSEKGRKGGNWIGELLK